MKNVFKKGEKVTLKNGTILPVTNRPIICDEQECYGTIVAVFDNKVYQIRWETLPEYCAGLDRFYEWELKKWEKRRE